MIKTNFQTILPFFMTVILLTVFFLEKATCYMQVTIIQKYIKLFLIFLFIYQTILFIYRNLNYITVVWLFKIAKSMWIIFNCSCEHPRWYLKVKRLYDYAICTSWQGGNKMWQLMSNTWPIFLISTIIFMTLAIS